MAEPESSVPRDAQRLGNLVRLALDDNGTESKVACMGAPSETERLVINQDLCDQDEAGCLQRYHKPFLQQWTSRSDTERGNAGLKVALLLGRLRDPAEPDDALSVDGKRAMSCPAVAPSARRSIGDA